MTSDIMLKRVWKKAAFNVIVTYTMLNYVKQKHETQLLISSYIRLFRLSLFDFFHLLQALTWLFDMIVLHVEKRQILF